MATAKASSRKDNKWLVELIRQQQKELKNLILKLFDKSLEGLHRTKSEVDDLRERHAWYHSNIYQLNQLKKKISSIQTEYDQSINELLNEIQAKKAKIKAILQDALDQLETTVDKNLVKKYLDQLLHQCDKLLKNIGMMVLLGPMFGAFGLFAIIVLIIAAVSGSAVSGLATLGIGALVGGVASEAIFRNKLEKLSGKLAENKAEVDHKKNQHLYELDSYFDGFVQHLYESSSLNSTVQIVWFPENIESDVSQSFANRVLDEFSSEKYQLTKFDQETDVTQFVRTNITNNIILITSGSAGRTVISKIGHYWNLKGIIMFCTRMDDRQLWTGHYKKLLLVTNSENEVIEKIKQIECGEIYFLINGFSLEDMHLKLRNVNRYFSTRNQEFIIPNFQSINANVSYHRNIVRALHMKIVVKNIYPNGIPSHFGLDNLYQFVDEFLQALNHNNPERQIIYLYTKSRPYYYKIVNDILNRLDEELIELIGVYIKALRYALVNYIDTNDEIVTSNYLKLYRGLCLDDGNSLLEFQRKFRVTDVIIFPSFVSTSLNKAVAECFAGDKGVILEITVDSTEMNRPKNISAVSFFGYEDEVLLNCFSILKVTDIREISNNLLLYECTLKFHLDDQD